MLHLSQATWAAILGGKRSVAAALGAGELRVDGPAERALRVLDAFDLPSLRRG